MPALKIGIPIFNCFDDTFAFVEKIVYNGENFQAMFENGKAAKRRILSL